MDLLQIIKLVTIPKWVKVYSLGLIAVLMGLAIYAIFGGKHLAEGSIVQGGMGLLGILLPSSIAILFLSFYESGVSPLKKATEKVLVQLLPDVLSHVQPRTGSKEPVRVTSTFLPEHTCRYKIEFAGGALLHLEVELNVKKVALILYLKQLSMAQIEKAIPHTLAGAAKEGYQINTVPIVKEWDGIPHHCLVMYKTLPSDFLWNSAEKLYFSQDLQVAVNSLVWEAGDLLLRKEGHDQ